MVAYANKVPHEVFPLNNATYNEKLRPQKAKQYHLKFDNYIALYYIFNHVLCERQRLFEIWIKLIPNWHGTSPLGRYHTIIFFPWILHSFP